MNKKVYQNRLRQMMLKCFALVLFLTAGVTFSSLMAQNQSAATSRTIYQQVSATRVSVTGQMPSAAKVAVTPVQRTAVQGKQVKGAYDITIQNGSKAWQPAAGQPVMVTIADADFTDGEYLDVYHEGANGPEFVATVSPENGKITFPAKSFSVYIVTESGAGARLKVNFHQTDGTVVSIFVKAADATDPETYKTVLYDPGVGSLNDGVQFRGWTENSNYTVNNADDGMTIDEVRTWVQPQLANVTDGTTVDLYPMLFKLYRVTYYDEIGTILSSKEVLFLVNSDQEYHACVINEPYSPGTSEQSFMGWQVQDGSSNIQGYTAGTLYQNGTTISIKGNVKLRANVPYGHWLVFDENGKGATYIAPQFIENGNTTQEPSLTMSRYGYQFVGWYTVQYGDEDTPDASNAFTFGNELTENTRIYAKWNKNTTANYTVIIWKQNVHDAKDAADSDKSYDFAESVSLTGTVDQVISTVTASGTGNSSYAVVNGTNKQYTGFHLNTFDENVTIATEGTSVLNVYYDRNLVTLTFRYRNNGQWADFVPSMTGLYGSSLSENNYTWPTGRWWYDGYQQGMGGYSGSGTRTTFLDAFLLSDGSDSQTFYGFTGNGTNTIYFLKQNEDGTYETANTVTSGNGTFNISDKYNGYKAVSYSTNNSTWTSLGEKDDNGYYGQVSNYTNLYIRYAPLTYNISYYDGIYVDGSNNPVDGYESRGQLSEVQNIPFESSISSYNKGGANYYEPTFSGFVFEGWYVDDACTQAYTFTNMPEGITVYAKWRQIQYRVFLHPNAVDPETGENDPTLDWGTEDQAMAFRVSHGGKVSIPTGLRDDYTIVGWYTDEACTQVFNADIVTITDQVATATYDKTVDKTDPMNKWGDIVTDSVDTDGNVITPYNSDAIGYNGGDRFWINNKLDLYAKWRSKLEGAKGIHIQYVYIDEDNETNVVLVQEEEDIFNDNVTTFSIPAPAPDMVLPGGGHLPNSQDSVFFQWIVMHYDADQEKFVDSDESVYPGSPYTVNKSDAMKEENPDYFTDPTQDQYVYTIQVRAQYVPVEKITPTFIVWYNNYEGAAEDTLRQDGKLNPTDPHANLFINQAVSIPVPAARSGYKFLGWFKQNWGEGETVTTTIDETAPNFLYYNENETEPKFYATRTYNETTQTYVYSNQADSVAADEANPYDYLYAIWEQTCVIPEVTVDPVTVCSGETATLEAEITNQDDQEEGTTYTYQWYTVSDSEEPAAISTATDATYNAPAAGTYGVIVSIGEDCASEMVTALVTINPLPEVTATATPATICAGQSSELSATGASTYVWSVDNTTVTPEETTKYYVTGTDANNCVNTDSVTVTVNPLPEVAATATPATICAGQSSELSATGASTYIWSVDNTTVTPEETTKYYVTGTDANNCVNTDSVTVTVNPLPEVTATATPATICAGQSSELSATGASTYVWSVDNTTVTPEETTKYYVTGTDANNCVNTDSVTVTVNPLPRAYLSVPESAEDLCPNQGTYEVAADASDGTYPYTLTWAGATASEENSYIAYVAQQGASDCNPNGTTYTVSVSVTDANNCTSESVEKSFTVKMPEDATISFTDVATSSEVACAAQATRPTLPVAKDACNNVLSPSDSVVTRPDSVACSGGTITYTYTYTDCAGNDADWVYTYTVKKPVLEFSMNSATAASKGNCQYEIPEISYNASYSCGDITVTQSPAAGTLIEQADTAQTIKITLTVTTDCGSTDYTTNVTIPAKFTLEILAETESVCNGGTAWLSAIPNPADQGDYEGHYTYKWNDAQQTSTYNLTVEGMTQTTTFTVTVTDIVTGCEVTKSKEIVVNEIPDATITGDAQLCAGESTTLTVEASEGATYAWSNGGNTNSITVTPTANTTYNVTVTAYDGCISIGEQEVKVNPLPVIALDSVRPTCTEKGSITVNVTTPTVADYTYTMNNEDPVTTNLTSYTFGGLNAGSYSFTLADANGCSTTAAQTLTLDQDEIDLNDITLTVCSGYEFSITPDGADDEVTYAWAAPSTSTGVSDELYDPAWATTPQGSIKGKLVNSGSAMGTAQYTVTPTLGDCALGVVTVTVNVDANVYPAVTLGIDATSPVCANQETLDVTANITNTVSPTDYTLVWTWQGQETTQTVPAGSTTFAHSIAIPTPETQTSYTLGLSYSDGVCEASTSTEIVVNPLPTLTVTPATQTITFGEPMEDVLVEATNATSVNVGQIAGFTFENNIISYNMDPRGNMPTVGTYNIPVNAQGMTPCPPATANVEVIVNPKPLTIKVDCEKMYDGTPFVVNYDNEECVTVTGLATGDELTAGTATTAVGTTPSYKVGHYTYTPASGLSFAAIEDGDVLVNPAFASTFGLENYDVTYDIALDITLRPITITAHDSTKVYDGVALTDTIYTISEPGLAENDEIASIAQGGSQFCVGTSAHTIDNALIIKTDDNNADVTDQYDITYVDGTLTVTDYTEFECPADLTIELNFGQCDTMFNPEIPTIEDIAEGMYTISNNLDELNPLDTGVHVITWTLTDTCNHIMATCDQTVTVVYRECPVAVDADNNTYQSVRIGCDCWTQTNLVSETYGSEVGGGAIEDVMTYNATPYFDDETANEQTYGHLYTWNAAIKDGADNGYGHVQGICPDGWYLPTKEKYEGLGAYGPEALRADILWADGGGTNTTGFTGLPGGRYVGNIDLYRDMTIMDYYWATTTDEAGEASAVEVELTMNCLRVKKVLNTNPNGYSIRCIKEREPETEGTETTEP